MGVVKITTSDVEVWTFSSVDDGASWFAGTKLPDPADLTNRSLNLTGGSTNNTRAVRCAENATLVVITDRIFNGSVYNQHCAFIVADQSINPVANGEQTGIIFKRGENRGTPEWL